MRTPARGTQLKWAKESGLSDCPHKERKILHHDHLINCARDRLRRNLPKHMKLSFEAIWLSILDDNKETFLTPQMVCKTCNEMDAALKVHKGEKELWYLPRGYSLHARDLAKLAEIKKGYDGNQKKKMAAVREFAASFVGARIEERDQKAAVVFAAIDSLTAR